MKLAMAQMHMEQSMERNLARTLEFCRAAEGSDLLFFRRSSCLRFSRSMKSGI